MTVSRNATFLVAALALSLAPSPRRVAASEPVPVTTTYLYHLATSTGVVPFSGVNLSYDRTHDELYVFGSGQIRVFNSNGMEIYTFGDSTDVGTIIGLGVLEDGDMITLSLLEKGPALLRCNFRGERLGVIEPKNVPADHADFVPGAMKFANGKIYLANLGDMTFMVLDQDGNFIRFFDTFPMMELDPEKRETAQRMDLGIKNFNIDKDGNILFVVQPLFRAYVLSLSGRIQSWGIKGSGPGKFNVVSGIASDDLGNYYVTDILKSAVIVFDKEFRFLREFGFRGPRAQNIVSPVDVAAGGGKVYVSQYAKRGVSVFKVSSGDDDEGPVPRRASNP